MAYASFRQFVDALDKAGELTRISGPVETDLLISEWANREMKSPGGGKALLFENPLIDGQPSKFPLAINTMGSRRRMALAFPQMFYGTGTFYDRNYGVIQSVSIGSLIVGGVFAAMGSAMRRSDPR